MPTPATPPTPDVLASQLTPELQALALKYVTNALDSPSRRSIRATNPHLLRLTDDAAGGPLLRAAGFEPSGDHMVVADESVDSKLRAVQKALLAARQPRASLLTLPDDLLVRCLLDLTAEDLSCWHRTCRGSREAAQGAQQLWLRLCAPTLRHGVRALTDRQQAALPHARVLCRLERVWALLENRMAKPVKFSLRPALAPEDAVGGASASSTSSVAGDATSLGLPAQVVASLLVHDGQFANISAEGPGLLFDGARLLSAAEIPEEARLNPPIEEGLLPLTNLQGYKQLCCRRDGTIVMVSGFNVHVKASCWSAFLERTLVDTI